MEDAGFLVFVLGGAACVCGLIFRWVEGTHRDYEDRLAAEREARDAYRDAMRSPWGLHDRRPHGNGIQAVGKVNPIPPRGMPTTVPVHGYQPRHPVAGPPPGNPARAGCPYCGGHPGVGRTCSGCGALNARYAPPRPASTRVDGWEDDEDCDELRGDDVTIDRVCRPVRPAIKMPPPGGPNIVYR